MRLFYLTQRGKSGTWYVALRDESGKVGTRKSTNTTNEREAEAIAQVWLRDGSPDAPRPSNQPFCEYLVQFWDFETSPYFQELLAMGKEGHRRHALDMQKNVRCYFIPYFGNKKLRQIKEETLQDFLVFLKINKGLAASTVNKARNAAFVAIGYAKRRKLIGTFDFDTRNIHAHILVTMRKIDANGFNSSKERSWNSKKYHSSIKQDICRVLNASLRTLGVEENLDSRSYKEQGIETSATRHKGPKRTAIERKDLPLYIDKEIKQDWSVCIRRRAIAIDESNGYKLIAKAITGTEDDKSKAISFFKSTEKKWIDHITESAPRNGQYSDSEISQQAKAMFTSNEAFIGLRQGKQKAMELFQPNQREYNGWER